MLDKLTVADFSQYIDQKFSAHIEGNEPMELVLTEATEMGAAPQDPQYRQAFSVVFVGPAQPILPQRIYRVEHEDMGALDLFLVPLGPNRDGRIRYETVFT
jgi:hypothetical protein